MLHERFGHDEETVFAAKCACGRPLSTEPCRCPFLGNLVRPPLYGRGKSWRADVTAYYAARGEQRAAASTLLAEERMFRVQPLQPWLDHLSKLPKERATARTVSNRAGASEDPVG